MIRKILIMVCLSGSIQSGFYAQSHTQEKPVTIDGTIKNGPDLLLHLQKYVASGMEQIDTARTDKKGKFSFSFNLADTGFYRIMYTESDFIALCLKPGEKLTVTADSKSLNKTYTVKGSEYSMHMQEFASLVNNYVRDKDTLTAQFKRHLSANQQPKADEVSRKMQTAYDNFIKQRDGFLNKYPKSPALFVVVSHLNPQTDLDNLKKIQAAMQASLGSSSTFTQYMNGVVMQVEKQREQEEAKRKAEEERLAKQQSIMPGKVMPEISMNDTSGNVLKLSSLKGKYVLVDFWASWCGPCRQENPNVVRLYEKYKDKGFTVYSVSLDMRRENWVAAIQRDGLKWPNHVSELKYWQTSFTVDHGITGIPFTILVDKDGKIIQTHLRGQALEMKLREIFGF